VLHNPTLLEPENVEADCWTSHVEFRLSNDVVAVGKDSDCVHSGVGRQASGPSPESVDAVLDLRIMLNKVPGIDDPKRFRIPGFETHQQSAYSLFFPLLANALGGWLRKGSPKQSKSGTNEYGCSHPGVLNLAISFPIRS
jgi:hypothetical protein